MNVSKQICVGKLQMSRISGPREQTWGLGRKKVKTAKYNENTDKNDSGALWRMKCNEPASAVFVKWREGKKLGDASSAE